jgi:hypothetical protein
MFTTRTCFNSCQYLILYYSSTGTDTPLGFFDPFGMLSGDAEADRFDRLRFVELKHGRICMLAFLGQVTTCTGLHLPGNRLCL